MLLSNEQKREKKRCIVGIMGCPISKSEPGVASVHPTKQQIPLHPIPTRAYSSIDKIRYTTEDITTMKEMASRTSGAVRS